jgi:hypothetical protein
MNFGSEMSAEEPAAWPSAVILAPGHVDVEIQIHCIQYANIKEVLISTDGDKTHAVWVQLTEISILKSGEKTVATVPKDLMARMRRRKEDP